MKEIIIATNYEPNECFIFVKSTKIGTLENKTIHSSSTEGCSKFTVEKQDKFSQFRRNWSQHLNTCKSQIGQDQVFEGVSLVYSVGMSQALITEITRSLKLLMVVKNQVESTKVLKLNTCETLIF